MICIADLPSDKRTSNNMVSMNNQQKNVTTYITFPLYCFFLCLENLEMGVETGTEAVEPDHDITELTRDMFDKMTAYIRGDLASRFINIIILSPQTF